MTHLLGLQPRSRRAPTLDNVLRGFAPRPHQPVERPGEKGVLSHGVRFNLDEYDYATHHITDADERAHVMARTETIITSVVLNRRPDLVAKRNDAGMTLDELSEMQVWCIDAMSADLAKTGVPRREVYLLAAKNVIEALGGEQA